MSATHGSRQISTLADAAQVVSPPPLVPLEHFDGTCLTSHIFAFYGERHALGATIDWEVNPGTFHWGHDLNRFGFLVRYDARPSLDDANEALRLLTDWIGKNGIMYRSRSPYAWGNLLNIAIRAENWLRFIRHADQNGHLQGRDAEVQHVLDALASHLFIVLRAIKRRGFKDNWSVIAVRSAIFIILTLPGLRHRASLLAIAQAYVAAIVSDQILPDGAQQELSSHYHWVTLELLASIATMLNKSGRAVPIELDGAIARMLRYLDALMSPSGAIVALGDSDPDYGLRIKAFLAGAPQRDLSLHGSDAKVMAFPYAGIVSYRNVATSSLLVFDGGPFGTAHQHEDALGVWMTAFGMDFLIDPGRHLYEHGDGTFWAYLKSTAAHSTIRIDGFNQNARADSGNWRRVEPGQPTVLSTPDAWSFEATYSGGYGPDRIAIVHKRTVRVAAFGTRVQIIDTLSGSGCHFVEQFWQVSPGAWSIDGHTFTAQRGGVLFTIECDTSAGLDCRVACGEREPLRGWYSRALNVVEASPTVIVHGHVELPVTLSTTIHAAFSVWHDGR